MTTSGTNPAICAPSDSEQTRHLESQSMRNWYLLAGVCAASTLGLLVAIVPGLQTGLTSFWPWARTDQVLFVGLGGSVLLLVLHLTMQQLKVNGMRRDLRSLEHENRQRERRAAARMHALQNVSRLMGTVNDLDSVFQGITDICLEIFDCQQASLMLLDGEKNELVMKAATGHVNAGAIADARQPVGSGIAGYVAKHRTAVVLGRDVGTDQYPGLKRGASDLTAAMVTPIMVRDELVGVVNISSRTPGAAYSANDLEALRIFAENAGTCIRQAERAEWMRQTIEQQRSQLDSIVTQDLPG